jgi:hypothetical protein
VNLSAPLKTDYLEQDRFKFEVCSAHGLLDGLRALAPHLGISFVDGDLAHDVAERINQHQSFGAGDSPQNPGARDAWLLLHEGALLAIRHRFALVIA